MNRSEILAAIADSLRGINGGNVDMSVYDMYSTSELKKILDDMKTVKVEASDNITNLVILAGAFLVLAIVILKK